MRGCLQADERGWEEVFSFQYLLTKTVFSERFYFEIP